MSDEIIDFHVNPAAQVKVPEEILSSIQRGIDCMAFNGLIGGPFRRAAGVSRAIGEDLAILIDMYSRNNPGHIEFRFVPEWTFGGEGALLSGTDTLVPHGLVYVRAFTVPALLRIADVLQESRRFHFAGRYVNPRLFTDKSYFTDSTRHSIQINRYAIDFATQCSIDATLLAFQHELAHIHLLHNNSKKQGLLLETEADFVAGASLATVLGMLPRRSWPGEDLADLNCDCPPRFNALVSGKELLQRLVCAATTLFVSFAVFGEVSNDYHFPSTRLITILDGCHYILVQYGITKADIQLALGAFPMDFTQLSVPEEFNDEGAKALDFKRYKSETLPSIQKMLAGKYFVI